MASRSTQLGSALDDVGIALPGVGSSVVEPLTGIAFWTAIALPFLHLPLLFTTGLSSSAAQTAFLALVALNVAALLVGHPHARSDE